MRCTIILFLVLAAMTSACAFPSVNSSGATWEEQQQLAYEKVHRVSPGASLQQVQLIIQSLATIEEPFSIWLEYIQDSGAITLVTYTDTQFHNTISVSHGKARQQLPVVTAEDLQQAEQRASALTLSPREVIDQTLHQAKVFAQHANTPESQVSIIASANIIDSARLQKYNGQVVWSVIYIIPNPVDILAKSY